MILFGARFIFEAIVREVAKLFHKQAQELSAVFGYDLITEKPLLKPKH